MATVRVKSVLASLREKADKNEAYKVVNGVRFFTRSGRPASLVGAVLVDLGVPEVLRKRVARDVEANTTVYRLLEKLGEDLDTTFSARSLLRTLQNVEEENVGDPKAVLRELRWLGWR